MQARRNETDITAGLPKEVLRISTAAQALWPDGKSASIRSRWVFRFRSDVKTWPVRHSFQTHRLEFQTIRQRDKRAGSAKMKAGPAKKGVLYGG